MEKCVFIKGNGVQSLTEMNLHLWSNDSSNLIYDKGNFQKYGSHALNANIYEGKEDSCTLKLPQKRSHDVQVMFGLDATNDFLAVEEEESVESCKSSLRNTNQNSYLDLHYILREMKALHEIKMKNYSSSLKHSYVWTIYNNIRSATECYANDVVKSDGSIVTKPKFSYDYQPNKLLNTFNTVISKPIKFDPIWCSLDQVSYKHTEKISVMKTDGKTNIPTCYLEARNNRICNSLFSEPIKFTPMQKICTNAIVYNNKISQINLTTGNYSAKFAVVYDRNMIIKLKKVTPKLNYNKSIKFSGLARMLHNLTININLRCAIHFPNLKDNFQNSVMCYSSFQEKKQILQCNYKPNYLNMGTLSRYLFDFGNLKYDLCVKKTLIKVTFPNCVSYSGKMKNLRSIFQISTVQLYDKLSESIKCLHERLESTNKSFAVKYSNAASIKKELKHLRFIKQTPASYRNELCVSKTDYTQLKYVIRKCISAFKNIFLINKKKLGKQTNQDDRSVMSVSTQSDATALRNVSKKTVGSQTSLSHMICNCSEKRSNFFSNASCKRKIEALNLETLPSNKVFTYKYFKSDSVGNESTKASEEINREESGKKKINNSCGPPNEEPKSDSISELKPLAKKNVFQYSLPMESKVNHSHNTSPSAGNCCRRGIRLGLSKKVRPGRKLAM